MGIPSVHLPQHHSGNKRQWCVALTPPHLGIASYLHVTSSIICQWECRLSTFLDIIQVIKDRGVSDEDVKREQLLRDASTYAYAASPSAALTNISAWKRTLTPTYKFYSPRPFENILRHLHEDGSIFCLFSCQFQNQNGRGSDRVSHNGQPVQTHTNIFY